MDQIIYFKIIKITTSITIAYIDRNPIDSSELTALIRVIQRKICSLVILRADFSNKKNLQITNSKSLRPAVPIAKSVTDDFIISLEDGRKMKSMKKYLTKLGMTPNDYRVKWKLPHDYPMIAPSYARTRSKIAKSGGIGRRPSEE